MPTKPCILVINDTQEVLDLFADLLTEEGYDVVLVDIPPAASAGVVKDVLPGAAISRMHSSLEVWLGLSLFPDGLVHDGGRLGYDRLIEVLEHAERACAL